MAQSLLLIYVPLDKTEEKQEYWKRYTKFYHDYWGWPTSPLGVWFGNEYDQFRNMLSEHLGMEEEKVEDCYFMKEEDRIYICPLQTGMNPYVISAENFIPIEWFLMFEDEERNSVLSHWGLGALYYYTKIAKARSRLEKAEKTIVAFIDSHKEGETDDELFQRMSELKPRISELNKMLSEYDSDGFILLNYGELASIIHPYTLKDERSVKDIWEILELMEKGNLETSQTNYKLLTAKWTEIRLQSMGDDGNSTLQ